jgi:hypothetical protein
MAELVYQRRQLIDILDKLALCSISYHPCCESKQRVRGADAATDRAPPRVLTETQ